ncbi:efflux RND transporter periplasmic adaptor subunit [Nitrosococcus watsonii]|uniref:Efflux transporter, RND family, MFP subunit n=1 Tax=Nitrosococcus watsoni (strain C-113) TaxID=105559 RepID=D8K6H3_NITWC|nr:efflux RND transporter periplasmic adaptor subunit [Nitrosococcus watsonii]ADJ28500.1 efflux transporter, RND family, MFP subunit [Nitrosococcus watsonii C-113]
MSKQTTMVIVLAFLIALAMGAGGGYWYATYWAPKEAASIPETPAKKPLFYRSPMNPEITSPVPAKDAMGMDYVPVYADEEKSGKGPAGTVKIDPVIVQDIGVRTAAAERRTLTRTIRAVGRVDYDEELLARPHPKTEGWIEKLFVDETGAKVQKDERLLSLYSPQLVATQQEYLLALRNLETLKTSPYPDIRQGAEELVQSTRERLQLLDVPEHQIRELEQTEKIQKNLHIHSPFHGVVLNIGVREGQYVTPQTEIYVLADLCQVWVYVDVYEYELPWVKVGDEAEMRVAAVPGRIFHGTVTYIYPYLEKQTRTVQLRLEFDNSDLLLKPEMFANVTIHASKQVDAVVVPEAAIVRSGAREQVFVVRGPGKFEPREVKVGVSAEGFTEILEGVKPGEKVVTSSQFLIDSESKLREATAKMREPQEEASTAPTDHQKHGKGLGKQVEDKETEAENPPSARHGHSSSVNSEQEGVKGD